jgi:hypothetical protein
MLSKTKARVVIFMDEKLLAKAEKLLSEMARDVDAAFVKLKNGASEQVAKKAKACRTWHAFKNSAGEEVTNNLVKAAEAYRVWYAFSQALADVTGRNIYKAKWNFQARLSDAECRLWIGIRGKAMPPVVLPEGAQKLLDGLKATLKPGGPRIMNMEDLTAAARDEIRNPAQTYRSLSRRRTGPSPD